MQSRVLDPLGMTSTTFDPARARRSDHANPHAPNVKMDFVPVDVSAENWVPPIRPAGGAWSSVHDMSRYALAELGRGRMPDGKQVVSEANLLKRREPMARINDKASYGLGVVVEDDHGVQLVWHNGGTLGFNTDLYVLPEHGVGVVVLTNVDGAGAFLRAVRRRILEVLFDGNEEALANLEFSLKRRDEAVAKEREKLRETPDPAWAKSLVGSFDNAILGRLRITYDGKRAVLDAGEWKSAFGQQAEEDGTFSVVLLDPPLVGFDFLAQVKDGRPQLTLRAPQQEYVFTRAP
ncbi:MAG: beta-lactamase family protein [Deltaproteobacteria bacterium]|nr:beta-lactamase family protein [Deltaproteobacteria bacterium]